MYAGTITYVYDATGVKLQKIVSDSSEFTTPEITKTSYVGNYIYEGTPGNEDLQFFNHAEGYVEPDGTSFDYVYQYKDHLGNIRLSYSDSDNNGTIATSEIISEKNYYPFGLEHKGYNNVITSTNPAQDYKYNGIELEESLGLNLYEMEFRQYDPAIGRFNSIDPIVHFDYSTYSAFDNNPIFYADPSGANSESFIMDLFNNSESGTTWTNNNDGTFSDGNGNTQDCDECKKLIAQRKNLETRLKELKVTATSKKKWVDLTRDLTTNGAIANIGLEYIDGISKLTDEQIEYLLANPHKVEQHVLVYIVQYELDIALGDRKISAETKNKTEREIGEERLSRLGSLSSRGILLANLANIYVSTATQLMHKTAQASQGINSAERLKVKNDLSKVNKRLKELSPN